MGQSTDAILVYGLNLDEGIDEDPIRVAQDALYERKDVVQTVRHCSCDYPMWIIGIEHTKKQASRGYPALIAKYGSDPSDLGFNANWPRLIEKVTTEFEIPFDAEKLGWWLASDWC